MEKVFTKQIQDVAVVKALAFLKINQQIGTVVYGSESGKRHKKLREKYINLLPQNVMFMSFPHYNSIKGSEELILFAEWDFPEKKEIQIRWKRLTENLISIEMPQNMKVRLFYQYGGTLALVSKNPLSDGKKGKLLVLPAVSLITSSSDEEE